MNEENSGARVQGIHMEGPFLSLGKCGVQNKKFIMPPDIDYFKQLTESFPGVILIVDVAPETKNAMEFITEASKICTVSLSHSQADYDTANLAIEFGLSHASHLFNAMNPINHRFPNAVSAILDHKQVSAELICDGIHLHPSVLRMAFALLGENRSIVVSDAIRAAGMPDGEYYLGGKKVLVHDKRTSFENGSLAGSTTSILAEFSNLIRYGIPWSQAVRSVSINPARRIGIDHETGSISIGKYADLTVLDKDLHVVMTIVRGKIAYRANTGGLQ
jgi:N-acetylglucosamine-6-phosphate deacetylase